MPGAPVRISAATTPTVFPVAFRSYLSILDASPKRELRIVPWSAAQSAGRSAGR